MIPHGLDAENERNLKRPRKQQKVTVARSPSSSGDNASGASSGGSRTPTSTSRPQVNVFISSIKRQNRMNNTEGNLSASTVPGGFPNDLTYRALSAYALLRTLSVQLRLSPFTPIAFLRALYLPFPNKLLGQVHVQE